MIRVFVLTVLALNFAPTVQAATTRFCLEGEFDLGARYQGTHPRGGEFYPTTWCVVTDDGTERVLFSGTGRSNPDLDGSWTVAYFPPERVRIVNRDNPPDIEFRDADNAAEARSVRRLDPHRLASEYLEHRERFSEMKVYAPAASEAFLETALNRPDMPADRLAALVSSIDVIPVADDKTIGTGESGARLVSLGANPHVDAMLGLWAVDRDYFFVSDIHVPHSAAEAPNEARAQTECWFAREAVAHLPDTVRVVNSHSGTVTPVSRLRAYLESDICQAPGQP